MSLTEQLKAVQAALEYLGSSASAELSAGVSRPDFIHKVGDEAAKALSTMLALIAQAEALEFELAAIREWLGPVELPPEGRRTKLDEMHACYAMLFQQLNALAAMAKAENAALKAQLAEAQR